MLDPVQTTSPFSFDAPFNIRRYHPFVSLQPMLVRRAENLCLCVQYLNFAAVLRSRRRASKSGCDLTARIIDSIAAIITPGSISPSVHSRKGSRGVGKLSQSASSQVADTSLDLAERSGSA